MISYRMHRPQHNFFHRFNFQNSRLFLQLAFKLYLYCQRMESGNSIGKATPGLFYLSLVMDKAARLKLKQFLEDNIPFDALKEAGFFDEKTNKYHYSKIAKRVCGRLGFKSIYEYKRICTCGMCDALSSMPKCKTFQDYRISNIWMPVKVDEIDIISKDSWLN